MKTLFRKKCPECGKKVRPELFQDELNLYMYCPKCQFKIEVTKDEDSLYTNTGILCLRWDRALYKTAEQQRYSKIPYAKPIEEGKIKKGGINKPPTTPKPKAAPKGQGKRK